VSIPAFLRFFAKKVTANICPFEPFVSCDSAIHLK
ncbi:MAG: hypothetical protein ACI8XW_001846, partial [Gammaproteobacteria bacterium]